MAHAFDRWDADAFLDEIDHEQFEEWVEFFRLEPVGWQARALQTTRLSYVVAQAHSPKKLKEKDYEHKLAGGGFSPAVERARWEAAAIQQQLHHAAKVKGRADG